MVLRYGHVPMQANISVELINFVRRAVKFGYTAKYVSIHDIIQERDKKMLNNIVDNEDHPLYDLLPPKKLR